MNTKICSQCKIKKEITEFYKQKLGKFGVHSVCKICFKEKQKEYNKSENGKISIKKSQLKESYQNYKIQYKLTGAYKIAQRKYRESYKEQIKDRGKNYRQTKKFKIWYKKYKQSLNFKKSRKKYLERPEVKEQTKNYNTNYNYKRYNNDKNYRFIRILGSRIRSFLSGQKSVSTEKLLGCSYEFARKWIEKQFTPEMNWNNIHIDHIRPLSSFTNLEQDQYKACNWKNLQPLLEKDNLEKQDNWDGTDENLTYSRQSLTPESKRELFNIYLNLLKKESYV
jgi:hypothetical protein